MLRLSIGAGAPVTFGDGLSFASEPGKFAIFGGGVSVVHELGSIGLLVTGALRLLDLANPLFRSALADARRSGVASMLDAVLLATCLAFVHGRGLLRLT